MSIPYKILQKVCQELHTHFSQGILSNISYKSPFDWIFTFRLEEKEAAILLSLDPQINALYLLKEPIKASVPLLPFFQNLKTTLKGAKLGKIELYESNRIVIFSFEKEKTKLFLILELFGHSRLFLTDDAFTLIDSTSEKKIDTYQFRSSTTIEEPLSASWKAILKSPNIHQALERWIENKKKKTLFDKEKKEFAKALQNKLKTIERAFAKTKDELKEAQNWQKKQHEADLLKSSYHQLNLGLKEITIPDWENNNSSITIALDPTLTPQELLDSFFKRSQKLKKAIKPLEKLLTTLEQEQKKWQDFEQELQTVENHDSLLALLHRSALKVKKLPIATKKEKDAHLPYQEFISKSGFSILVGKSGKDNDLLTFQVGRSKDLWLHIHGHAGSHVIIQGKKEKSIDKETLEAAAQLAIYFSKARSDSKKTHEVVFTERQNVFRIKGASPGKVSLSKFKTIQLRINLQVIQELKKVS